MALHHPITPGATLSRSVFTDLQNWVAQHERVHLDLGTGDGKFALQLARREPAMAVIGLDTSLDHLHGARRRHPGNVRFASLDALDWPFGAIPVADTVTVNFPYGSLLRGLVEGDPGLIARLDVVLGAGSRLEVRANESAFIANGLDPTDGPQAIASTLGQVEGLRVNSRDLSQAELRSFPSSWSKRLGYGRATCAWLVEARR